MSCDRELLYITMPGFTRVFRGNGDIMYLCTYRVQAIAKPIGIDTKVGLCKHVHTVPALHESLHVHMHGDNWLEPCRVNDIVMTSASRAHSKAIGSRVLTCNGTWV